MHLHSDWLTAGKVRKLVLVIEDQQTGEAQERWEFDVGTDQEAVDTGVAREKSPADIQKEIAAIIRSVARRCAALGFNRRIVQSDFTLIFLLYLLSMILYLA